jgi:hypothetical protein
MFANLKVDTVLVFFLLLPFVGFGQEVVVCKSQQSGVPSGAAAEWKVDAFPIELTLFYNNGKTTINERVVNFIVESEKRFGLAPVEVSMVVSQGRNWISAPFAFERAGKYVITAFRPDKSVLATSLISIEGPEVVVKTEAVAVEPVVARNSKAEIIPADNQRFDAVQRPESQIPVAAPVKLAAPLNAEEQKTLKFEEVNIAFGIGVADKKLKSPATTFTEAQTRKGIIVQLSNSSQFGAESVSLDIWKKSSATASDYDELIVNTKVAVSPKGYTTQAPITLFKKGEYKVSFFTPDFVWIGSAYLTVN